MKIRGRGSCSGGEKRTAVLRRSCSKNSTCTVSRTPLICPHARDRSRRRRVTDLVGWLAGHAAWRGLAPGTPPALVPPAPAPWSQPGSGESCAYRLGIGIGIGLRVGLAAQDRQERNNAGKRPETAAGLGGRVARSPREQGVSPVALGSPREGARQGPREGDPIDPRSATA